jgi:hypothetical protein
MAFGKRDKVISNGLKGREGRPLANTKEREEQPVSRQCSVLAFRL